MADQVAVDPGDIGFVGQQAMQAVTMVSQLEGQLGQACPLAVTRLQGIADITALSMPGASWQRSRSSAVPWSTRSRVHWTE